MTDPLPKFESPPVVETVLGVQFAPLPEFTGAMSGWFWKSYLGSDWTKTHDSMPLQDQFERFGNDAGWVSPGIQLVGTEATRTQLIRTDEERMIQIQFSRFILNWKRGAGRYPSYDVLLPEFEALLGQFRQFTNEAGCGDLALNQWEVTYVNHIMRGEMWSSLEEVGKIFKSFGVPAAAQPVREADSLNVAWRYIIGENSGRLHVVLNHVRTADNKEALRLQLVARGPLSSGSPDELRNCLNKGHESIVRTFAAITSSDAHKHWKRTQ
jgi:uncharacterized protein (TIGR04255 family)